MAGPALAPLLTVDLRHGVAARLAGLSLTRRGRLTEVQLCSEAVHCGLLVDLALSGRIEETDDAVVVDGAATGFAPADELLEAVLADPDRRLVDWVEDGRIGAAAVAEALVAAGVWTRVHRPLRRDRFHVADEELRRQDLALPDDPTDSDVAQWSAADAAVAALAGTAAMLGEARERGWRTAARPVPERVLAATGTARWACEASIAYLAWARQWRRYGARVLGVGDGTPG